MTPRVALRGVTRVFGDGAGIHDVDLHVDDGEIVALVGLNGAGKTTLMRVMLGMLRPTAGHVELDGIGLAQLPGRAWAGVGHLIEVPLVYRELTGRQNLRLDARLHRADPNRIVDAVVAELDLTRHIDKRTATLSLGNRQRVGLAAALQHHPDLIVLDEPTNSLDPSGVILLREALRRRADAGAAVLVSSHHLDEVARIADRIEVINGGRMIGRLDPHTAELERVFFEKVRAHDEVTHT